VCLKNLPRLLHDFPIEFCCAVEFWKMEWNSVVCSRILLNLDSFVPYFTYIADRHLTYIMCAVVIDTIVTQSAH